jgi:hypothetical protein
MGFNTSAIRFFLATKQVLKVDPRTLIVGHQNFSPSISLLGGLAYKKLITDWKHPLFVDDFLACSGVNHQEYLDLSNYEGATILHDLNKPIPEELRNSFDLVIEAGTLEHVPDIFVGFENLKSLVKVGGHLIMISPANNFLGHGCYQLSPEIFFRGLSTGQGFEIEYFLLHQEGVFGGKWFTVPDSQKIGQRVDIKSRRATYICVLATKVGNPMNKVQNQSDYESIWKEEAKISRLGHRYNQLPYVLKRVVYFWMLKPKYHLRSRRNQKKVATKGLLRLPQVDNLCP